MNESLITFLFEVANFVALAALLAWLFFKPVRKALEQQRAQAKQQEDRAAQALHDAENLRRDVERQRQALAAELETMRAQARETAQQDAERIVAEARAQIERERATLKRDALHIEQSQSAQIARAVAITAHGTMKRFFEQLAGPELEQTLVRAACRELQAFADNSLAPVTVESAKPLDDESQRLIGASLGPAAQTVDFRVVSELEGGLRISTARGLIDASITGLAAFAEHSLSASIQSMIRDESESD